MRTEPAAEPGSIVAAGVADFRPDFYAVLEQLNRVKFRTPGHPAANTVLVSGLERAQAQAGNTSDCISKAGSAAGMMLFVQRFHPGIGHVGVDLGGGKIGMPQQELDDSQVGAVIEQVGCEGMPQFVG